jgi:uncharacterized membrane-anchored protein
MRGRIIIGGLIGAVLLFGTAQAQQAANDPWAEIKKLRWEFAGVGHLGGQASIQIPSGYAFLGTSDTARFLELNGNLTDYNQYTFAPTNLQWFAIFNFSDSGYVRDDEQLDPDALLGELKRINQATVEEKRRRGFDVLWLEGWFVEPHYDLMTKRLEWGTRLRNEKNSQITVNYTIKLLGRHGVMNAVLVSEPQSLEKDMREFKSALKGYSYNEGNRYAEFRSGDKTAEYGLSALIIGGAAAAAAKSGAFKGLLKLIGVGIIALLGAIGAFFKKLFRRS